MQTTALSLILLGTVLVGTTPSLYGNCQSCERLKASHQDDLTQTDYYEDSPYFKSSQQQSENNAPDIKQTSVQTTEAPSQRNTIRRNRELRTRNSNDLQKNDATINSSMYQNPINRSATLPETNTPVDVQIEEIEQVIEQN